jgi:TonB family protein
MTRFKTFVLFCILFTSSLSVLAQRVITAKVVDSESKKPIKDAKVKIKGTDVETVTNYLGFFQLTIDSINQISVEHEDYETGNVVVPELESFQISLTKLRDDFLDRDSIFTVVEDRPTFPGGMEKFYQFVFKNLNYPGEARKRGITGKMFVEFVVDSTGNIPTEEVKVIKGLCESCDREVIRVIRMSPRWIPGTINSIPVRQKMVMPIIFQRY